MRVLASLAITAFVAGAGLVGWAYLHRASWYHQDFARALQQRIQAELIPGQTAELDPPSLAIREVGRGRRLVCGTMHIHENGRAGQTFRYAVQFWPTLFGGSATDIATPRDRERRQPGTRSADLLKGPTHAVRPTRRKHADDAPIPRTRSLLALGDHRPGFPSSKS